MEGFIMTELGKMIKILRIQKGGITQAKLASDLNYSSSKLSSIMSGATEPNIPFILKCQKYFELDKEKTIEMFTKALSSYRTIVLDTSYLIGNRKDLLIEVIVALLLMPEFTTDNEYQKNIDAAVKTITENFKCFEKIREFSE
jgi:transcriptional regulator with XRE-family HTH domain